VRQQIRRFSSCKHFGQAETPSRHGRVSESAIIPWRAGADGDVTMRKFAGHGSDSALAGWPIRSGRREVAMARGAQAGLANVHRRMMSPGSTPACSGVGNQRHRADHPHAGIRGRGRRASRSGPATCWSRHRASRRDTRTSGQQRAAQAVDGVAAGTPGRGGAGRWWTVPISLLSASGRGRLIRGEAWSRGASRRVDATAASCSRPGRLAWTQAKAARAAHRGSRHDDKGGERRGGLGSTGGKPVRRVMWSVTGAVRQHWCRRRGRRGVPRPFACSA